MKTLGLTCFVQSRSYIIAIGFPMHVEGIQARGATVVVAHVGCLRYDRYATRHVTPPLPRPRVVLPGTRGSTLTPGRSHADRVHHLSLSRTPVALHVDPGALLVPGVCSCAKQAYEEVLSKQRCLFFEGAQQHPRKKLRKQVLPRATY